METFAPAAALVLVAVVLVGGVFVYWAASRIIALRRRLARLERAVVFLASQVSGIEGEQMNARLSPPEPDDWTRPAPTPTGPRGW